MNTLHELININLGLRVNCACNNTRDLDMSALLKRFGGDKLIEPQMFRCSRCGCVCKSIHVFPTEAGVKA